MRMFSSAVGAGNRRCANVADAIRRGAREPIMSLILSVADSTGATDGSMTTSGGVGDHSPSPPRDFSRYRSRPTPRQHAQDCRHQRRSAGGRVRPRPYAHLCPSNENYGCGSSAAASPPGRCSHALLTRRPGCHPWAKLTQEGPLRRDAAGDFKLNSGAPRRARTANRRIKSPLLCH